jgi:hypothetical protein
MRDPVEEIIGHVLPCGPLTVLKNDMLLEAACAGAYDFIEGRRSGRGKLALVRMTLRSQDGSEPVGIIPTQIPIGKFLDAWRKFQEILTQ